MGYWKHSGSNFRGAPSAHPLNPPLAGSTVRWKFLAASSMASSAKEANFENDIAFQITTEIKTPSTKWIILVSIYSKNNRQPNKIKTSDITWIMSFNYFSAQGRAMVFARGGGGRGTHWQDVSLSTAPALQKALSGRGGANTNFLVKSPNLTQKRGRGTPTHLFFRTEKLCGKIITIQAKIIDGGAIAPTHKHTHTRTQKHHNCIILILFFMWITFKIFKYIYKRTT